MLPQDYVREPSGSQALSPSALHRARRRSRGRGRGPGRARARAPRSGLGLVARRAAAGARRGVGLGVRAAADRRLARLAAALGSLAERAAVPVRDVLVADASRRTRKVNAYVSGLGATRRVVVFDTLLERMGTSELHVVVAHELGHRRFRHPAKGTLLGM